MICKRKRMTLILLLINLDDVCFSIQMKIIGGQLCFRTLVPY